MKTLFLYIDTECVYFFFEKEGDYSHLNGTFLNLDEGDQQEELMKILYGDNGKYDIITNKLKEPTKDWDFFVIVGMAI